jgi:predicted transposase YdaD
MPVSGKRKSGRAWLVYFSTLKNEKQMYLLSAEDSQMAARKVYNRVHRKYPKLKLTLHYHSSGKSWQWVKDKP